MNASGGVDTTNGIRSFVVGTGGRSHYGTSNRPAGLEVIDSVTFGILRLTLRSNGYDWRFLPEAGKAFTDSGTGTCR